METNLEKTLRRTLPELWPRFALWVALCYVVDGLHARLRPELLRWLPAGSLSELYVLATTTVIVSFTIIGLGALVACYYYALRERRINAALTETGLAVRVVSAGLLALAGFVLALLINDGGFLR